MRGPDQAMYTRCPRCHTVFSLSETEYRARNGLVRCGRCLNVFQSGDTLLEELPAETGSGDETAGKAAAAYPPPESAAAETSLAFPLLGQVRRPRTRTPFWVLGNLLLVLLLGAQVLYFYGQTLVQGYPPAGRIVAYTRNWLGLPRFTTADVGLIDLEHAQIAVRPRVPNALRISATLVNRATTTQPFPLLEVTFSGAAGKVIARRVFHPQEYLGAARSRAGMLPDIAVTVSFDVLNPGKRAVGYEIRLFAARQKQ